MTEVKNWTQIANEMKYYDQIGKIKSDQICFRAKPSDQNCAVSLKNFFIIFFTHHHESGYFTYHVIKSKIEKKKNQKQKKY